MKFSRIILAALATTLVTAASTSAQYVRPTTGGPMREFNFNNPMSALAATMVMNKAREDALAKRLGVSSSGNGSSSASRPPSRPVKPADESSLRFRPAGGYLKTRELADQLGDDPAQRDQYFKVMNAVLDEFGKKLAAAGLQNDVAIALSYFFGENIRIYRGLPELSDQQFVNLRNTIAKAITAGGGLGNATDRQKQEMYETLVAYTGITQFGYESSKQANNEQAAKGFQQVAGQNLQTVTKVSPDNINLTDDGLSVSGPQAYDTNRHFQLLITSAAGKEHSASIGATPSSDLKLDPNARMAKGFQQVTAQKLQTITKMSPDKLTGTGN